jgi:hypothetical protein
MVSPKKVNPECQHAKVTGCQTDTQEVIDPWELRSLCQKSHELNRKLNLYWNRYESITGEEDNHQVEEDVAEVNASQRYVVDSVGLAVYLPEDGVAEDGVGTGEGQPRIATIVPIDNQE